MKQIQTKWKEECEENGKCSYTWKPLLWVEGVDGHKTDIVGEKLSDVTSDITSFDILHHTNVAWVDTVGGVVTEGCGRCRVVWLVMGVVG